MAIKTMQEAAIGQMVELAIDLTNRGEREETEKICTE